MTPRFPMAILTAAILSLPALALAGPGRDASPACAAKHAEKLATHDANADGKLDRDERMAIHRDKRAAALTRHDANRDGKLDRDERLVMKRERMDTLFQQHDSNRDGVLSAAETEATCSRLSRHFDAIDADRNGQLSRTELQAHHEHRGAHRRGKHGKHGRWRHHDNAQ
jgi:Ca2+-binding EF-hand superfamily protein